MHRAQSIVKKSMVNCLKRHSSSLNYVDSYKVWSYVFKSTMNTFLNLYCVYYLYMGLHDIYKNRLFIQNCPCVYL